MRIALTIIFLLGVVTVTGSAQSPAPSPERDVREAFARFNTAFVTADTLALGRMVADDYVHTNYTGSVLDRATWLGWVSTRRRQLDDGSVSVEAYVADSVGVRLRGSVAILTALIRSRTRDSSGVQERRFQTTQVWAREGAQWKRIAFHDAVIP